MADLGTSYKEWIAEKNEAIRKLTEERDQLKEEIKQLQVKWIPVSERLPEEYESVLVCYKSQGGMAQLVSERLVNKDGSNRWSAMMGQNPIAWMPLPKPPKEGRTKA